MYREQHVYWGRGEKELPARKHCQNLSTVTRAGKVKWRSRKNKRKYEVDNMHMHVKKKRNKKKKKIRKWKRNEREREIREKVIKKMLSKRNIFELRDLNVSRTWIFASICMRVSRAYTDIRVSLFPNIFWFCALSAAGERESD